MKAPTATTSAATTFTFTHAALRDCAVRADAEPQGSSWCQALRLLGDRRSEPDSLSHSAAMAACAAGGRWEEVLQLLAELGAPLPPNVADPYTAGGSPDELWDSADAAEELPDVAELLAGQEVSLSSLSNLWREALELLAQPQGALAEATSSPTPRRPEDVLGLSAVIEDTCRQGQWEQALSLLGELRQLIPPPHEAATPSSSVEVSQDCKFEEVRDDGTLARQQDYLFSLLDVNHRGFIDRQELRHALHNGLLTAGDGLIGGQHNGLFVERAETLGRRMAETRRTP